MLKVQIRKGEIIPFDFTRNAPELCGKDFLNDGEIVGEIKISGKVEDVGGRFLIRGKILCEKKFVCDRCLADSTQSQVHKFFEELETVPDEDDLIDIEEIVLDTMAAGQSLKNLFRDDCKGLCPVCGSNLNDGDCGCNRKEIDPRFAVLQDFKSIGEV